MSRLTALTSLLSTPPIKAFDTKQLRQIAKLTGANTGAGTKGALASSILSAVGSVFDGQDASHPSTTQSVLSIDMGVANLAYCKLDLKREPGSKGQMLPVVREWSRVSVLHKDSAVTGPQSYGVNSTDYSTENLARAATRLVHHLVLSRPKSSHPSRILIERQRWRTMGGTGVLEWTIRVNTLEAMLWAVLTQAQQQGLWGGKVHSVDPGRVASWWFDRGEEKGDVRGVGTKAGTGMAKAKTAGQKYRALKGAKVEVVRKLFGGECGGRGCVVSGSLEGDGVVLALRSVRTEKLDDLADCLLQGLAFAEWLRNREIVAQKGEDGLRELLEKHAGES